MATPRTERRHQSIFFRDLASPISSAAAHHRGSRFATPGQAAAVSALWRENFSSTAADTPPPPPVFTLDDRLDFTPEPALVPADLSPSPERNYLSTPPPSRGNVGVTPPSQKQESPGSGSWWSPMRVGSEEKGGRAGSPVEGVVHQHQQQAGALLMLPPPSEVVRPELRRSNLPAPAASNGGIDEEEWVTVYGFFPGDINLVLREFEKCGIILKHIPGPMDANWMHILYQNRYDAQKALGKNGMQLNNALVIGVKPVDPVQCQYLNERLNSSTPGAFIPLWPQSAGRNSAAPLLALPNHLPNGSVDTRDKGHHSTGAVASPAKSVVSKVMDLMFGL